MNIIIHRYNSICEPDFIDAFRTVGLNVIEDDVEMYQKNIPLEKRVEKLGELILTCKPLFVFTINFFPYISMICEKLQVKYVCVSVDCPVVELYSEMIRNKCNRIFLFDYRQYLDIYEENPECIFHMPLGVNVARLDETIGEPDINSLKNPSNFKYDVSFVGSLYSEKNPYPDVYSNLSERIKGMCDGFLAAQSVINGQQLLEQSISQEVIDGIKSAAKDFYPSDLSVRNLDKFVAVNNYLAPELTVRDRLSLLTALSHTIKDHGKVHLFTRSNTDELKKNGACVVCHGGVKSLDEMPLVFRTSKINLNPTMRSIQMGLPQRIWDVLGAGGFLLTNYQDEIPEYFEVGKHLEAYESVEEACEKVLYYLSHADERIEIAQNGYELVKQKHTVINRVIEIIRIISSAEA